MPNKQNLLIVVADAEHVRFVRAAQDNALHGGAWVEAPSVHQRSSALGSDHPGAAMHSGSSAHHAFAPRHDPKALGTERFAHAVAQALNAAAADGEFDEMVIVAPPHVLSEIRGALDTTTASRIIGTLAKDLVKVPDDELWTHLRPWVRPVHRAV